MKQKFPIGLIFLEPGAGSSGKDPIQTDKKGDKGDEKILHVDQQSERESDFVFRGDRQLIL